MSSAPAFQFYPHDFVGGRVATYSLDEIGAYSLLLAFDWSLNGLPTETEKLAKLCRVSHRKFLTLWATISDQFPLKNGRRHNPRLALEREKQQANRKKKQDAAHSRWNADADAGALQTQCSPSPSPTPVTTTAPLPPPRATEPDEREGELMARLATGADREGARALLSRAPNRTAWVASLLGFLDGLGIARRCTPEHLGQAIRDYVANGASNNPNMRQFRRYVEDATRPPSERAAREGATPPAHLGTGGRAFHTTLAAIEDLP